MGAGVLHYNCYFIQDSFSKRELTFMRERYNRLVEDAIEFLTFSKEFIEKEENKELTEKISIEIIKYENITLADGYKLHKNDD